MGVDLRSESGNDRHFVSLAMSTLIGYDEFLTCHVENIVNMSSKKKEGVLLRDSATSTHILKFEKVKSSMHHHCTMVSYFSCEVLAC